MGAAFAEADDLLLVIVMRARIDYPGMWYHGRIVEVTEVSADPYLGPLGAFTLNGVEYALPWRTKDLTGLVKLAEEPNEHRPERDQEG